MAIAKVFVYLFGVAAFFSFCCLRCCAFASQPINGYERELSAEAAVKCGAQCLFTVLCSLGKGPDRYSNFEKMLGPPGREGYSLLKLRDVARKLGCKAECVKLSYAALASIPTGVEIVLHVKPNHFQLCTYISPTTVSLLDPSVGVFPNRPKEDFQNDWTGYALLVSNEEIVLPQLESGFGREVFQCLAIVTLGVSLTFIIVRARRK